MYPSPVIFCISFYRISARRIIIQPAHPKRMLHTNVVRTGSMIWTPVGVYPLNRIAAFSKSQVYPPFSSGLSAIGNKTNRKPGTRTETSTFPILESR